VRGAGADKLCVYVSSFVPGDAGALHSFQVDTRTGAATATRGAARVENPFFFTIAPRPSRLYCVSVEGTFLSGPSHVIAFAIEQPTGALRFINRRPSGGAAACFLSVNAAGDALLVANYASGSLASYALAADGSLNGAHSLIEDGGRDLQTHCMLFSPDDRRAFSAALSRNEIRAYDVDAGTRSLRRNPLTTATLHAGCDPRHMRFHPRGRSLYVLSQADNSVAVVDYDPDSGSLRQLQRISTLPPGHVGESLAADLQITPDGSFLYASNRGHDSIAQYRIGTGGLLTRIGIGACAGRSPHGLAISPCGKYLACANLDSDAVAVFRIDARTGSLEPAGPPVPTARPSCVAIVAMN
jgi:6-phosphogluconolactonase